MLVVGGVHGAAMFSGIEIIIVLHCMILYILIGIEYLSTIILEIGFLFLLLLLLLTVEV